MPRGSFTEQDKEKALAFIRQNPQVKLPELARRFSGAGISESSLAKWRQEIREETNVGQQGAADSEGADKQARRSDKQRLQELEQTNQDLLLTIKIQQIEFYYLRKFALAPDDMARKDVEINYFIALLAEHGMENPKRLSAEEEPAEGE